MPVNPLRLADELPRPAVAPLDAPAAVRLVLSVPRPVEGGAHLLPVDLLDRVYQRITGHACHDLGELQRLDDALRAACAVGASARVFYRCASLVPEHHARLVAVADALTDYQRHLDLEAGRADVEKHIREGR